MTHTEISDATKAAGPAKQGAHVAQDAAAPKRRPTRQAGAPKGRKTAKTSKAKGAAPKRQDKADKKAIQPKLERAPRAESKGARILELMGRAKGATLAEIMAATGWQAHSLRGFISTTSKKHGVKIDSSKNETGDRVYRIEK